MKGRRFLNLVWLVLVAGMLCACSEPPSGTQVKVEAADAADTADTAVSDDEHAATPAAENLEAGMVNPGYEDKPDWFVESFLDIREDVDEAAADDRRVVLYFYQDGCPYCKKLLDTNFSLADIVERTRNNFNVIAINMWGDREVTGFDGAVTTEKDFARALRVMFTPTMLFLDEDGNIVKRLNGYYPPHRFMTVLDYARQHNGSDPTFREYLADVAPAPASGRLHQDAAFLDSGDLATRNSDKPLLVMFEQKDCAPCDELHLDILQRPESRAQLERLDVVLLDMWSNDPLTLPDGTQSTPAQWAKTLQVQYAPSLVFFDTDNREVFRTDAYLKAFHTQSSMDYVASGAYLEQPEFQRFIAARADALEAQGIHVDLME